VLILLLAALLALGAFLPLTGSFGGNRAGAVPVYRVERRTFERRVPAQGELRAVRATPITVPTAAPGPFRISWLAPDRSRVQAGEVVVRFDSSEIEKNLTDAEADLTSARLRAQKQRIEGSANLDKLTRDLELARMELDNARQFAKKDELIYSRHDIIESEIDSDLAHEKEKHARDARHTQEQLSATELDLIGIDARKADMKIGQARQALTALAVTAPHDGVLVLQRDWQGNSVRVGDSVWNGQPLAEIPELAAMQAEVFVLEADAGGLAPGKPARVVIESDPTVSYGARIQRVDSLAKPRLRGSPVQYFAVTLALDRTDPRVMKPGQRVRALLALDDRPDALAVPRQAVFEREGKMIVYRRERRQGRGAGFEPVAVTLGPSGAGRVVVEAGIRPGDVLALADPARPRTETGAPPKDKAPLPASPVPGAAAGGRP
jgi:multidrug resistance efflux pump